MSGHFPSTAAIIKRGVCALENREPQWELDLSLLILLKGGPEWIFRELCVFDGLAKKMCCSGLWHKSVMWSPRFTAGNGLFGKNNNTGAYLDGRGCSPVAMPWEESVNASCFWKSERATIWSLNFFISGKLWVWDKLQQEHRKIDANTSIFQPDITRTLPRACSQCRSWVEALLTQLNCLPKASVPGHTYN